ncbi:hypothetical protein MNBD_DELTA01-1564 [hydrothermal vent metagenome]|uniref:Response regulatory domain-containing protein n=1 Tax=hydrothermal vent metagenome TaxID=652676 RepID=A0A3B0QQB0_9ZZZZ
MQSHAGEAVNKGSSKRLRGKAPEDRAILIVDDEETVGLGMSEMLKLSGFKAAFVTGGTAAIEEVRKNGYSLVFMDIIMPGLNGLDAYRLIREIDPNIKVVLFTGFYKDADTVITEGVREGMIDEFIRKPFFASEIIDIARKYV